MKMLFISRKNPNEIGGLARFTYELSKRLPNSYLLSPANLTSFYKIRFSKIDLIHLAEATLLPLGFILGLIFRKPFTVTAHGRDLTFPNPLYQKMLKLLLSKAKAVILDSREEIPLLRPFNLPRNKIHVINLGVSTDYFKKVSPVKIPEFANKTILISVGNLVRRKGHAWFGQKVLPLLPDNFVYFIIGDGPEKYKITGLNRVFFLGRLNDDKLGWVLKQAHVYVSPNQRVKNDFEGFGIAHGEAAAMGLPVVASRVDGIPSAIKNGKNGILVLPKPVKFIKVLEKLKDPKVRKVLGQKARTYTLKNYSWNKTLKAYLEVFRQVSGKI